MTRLGTWPIPFGALKTTTAVTDFPGQAAGATAPNLTTSVIRKTTSNNRRAVRCQGSASNSSIYNVGAWGAPASARDRDYFLRFYFNVDTLPASTITILLWSNAGAGGLFRMDLTSGGKLQLFDNASGHVHQLGSDSSTTIAVNTWYRFEMRIRVSSTSGNHGQCEAYLYGGTDADSLTPLETLCNDTAVDFLSTSSNAPGNLGLGWQTAPGASRNMYLCDIALNDDQGSAHNSWPGVGLLMPMWAASDSSRGSWTTGNGGTSNVYDSINGGGASANGLTNGSTDANATTTPTNQAKNAANSASDNGDFNLQDYTTAGLPSGEDVVLAGAVAAFGPATATAIDAALELVSNPAISSKTLTGSATSVGAFATGWKFVALDPSQNPTVTAGTGPVIRIGKRTATATALECCGALGWFESTPSGATETPQAISVSEPLTAAVARQVRKTISI